MKKKVSYELAVRRSPVPIGGEAHLVRLELMQASLTYYAESLRAKDFSNVGRRILARLVRLSTCVCCTIDVFVCDRCVCCVSWPVIRVRRRRKLLSCIRRLVSMLTMQWMLNMAMFVVYEIV